MWHFAYLETNVQFGDYDDDDGHDDGNSSNKQ